MHAATLVLRNGVITAVVCTSTGRVLSVIDHRCGDREAIAEGSPGNSFVLFDDVPFYWYDDDTCACQRMAFTVFETHVWLVWCHVCQGRVGCHAVSPGDGEGGERCRCRGCRCHGPGAGSAQSRTVCHHSGAGWQVQHRSAHCADRCQSYVGI